MFEAGGQEQMPRRIVARPDAYRTACGDWTSVEHPDAAQLLREGAVEYLQVEPKSAKLTRDKFPRQMSPSAFIWWTALAVVLTIFLMVEIATGQALHDPTDPKHWYDADCCSQRDCAPVPIGVIKGVKNGWFVEVAPGQHPMAHNLATRLIPYGHKAVRQSLDGRDHVCISPISNRVLCAYITPRGC